MDDGSFFDLPEQHEAGVYANDFGLWHTEHEFTIDFAVKRSLPWATVTTDHEEIATAVVISRIRLPPILAFELIRSVSQEMADYEDEWGEIHRPRRRGGEES